MTSVRKLAIAAAAVLIVVGCGSDDSDTSMPGMSHGAGMETSAAQSDHNAADVTFLQLMYPHHVQAVAMANLVPSRSQDPAVAELAAAITKAQAPELGRIADILQRFGEPVPSADADHDMPGTMSPDTMKSLEGSSGTDFDKAWLSAMIDHHNGAIEMAKTEVASGSEPEVKTLADAIATAQQAEIDQMRTMLAQK